MTFLHFVTEMLNITHIRTKRQASSERRFVELLIVADRLEVRIMSLLSTFIQIWGD